MKRRKNATLKSTKKRADKVFSEYIRKRDTIRAKPICATCNEFIDFKTSDAGHFIARNYAATRFDEQNVNAQCRRCNRFQSGRQYEHGRYIDKLYGQGTAEKLLIKSKMLCKRTIFDYEQIIEQYKKKIECLES